MKPQEFADLLGVNVKTLHRWDQTGKLVAKRTPSNHRYYTELDLALAKGLHPTPSKRKNVLYCRVSSKKQTTELENQKDSINKTKAFRQILDIPPEKMLTLRKDVQM